jgi:hypothetical protein
VLGIWLEFALLKEEKQTFVHGVMEKGERSIKVARKGAIGIKPVIRVTHPLSHGMGLITYWFTHVKSV